MKETVFELMAAGDFEEVAWCRDAPSRLLALVAIHHTGLGPAIGGIRMLAYPSDREALVDVLRLARAMSLKAALAGLACGGGKSVIIGDPTRDKTEVLLRAFGRYIEGLGGRYIPTEDMGTTTADLAIVRRETRYAVGLPEGEGGGGDPSPMTAWGVVQGMRACIDVLGLDGFEAIRVAIQGLGKVGAALARYLHERGARLVVADVDARRAAAVAQETGAEVVAAEVILGVPCDILSPCARGPVFAARTVPALRCRAVAGAANNQVATDADGDMLHARGILYAPDFAINVGGLINVADELAPGGYSRSRARAKTDEVYGTLRAIFAETARTGTPPHRVALLRAEARLAEGAARRPLAGWP